ncbi:MAG: hypothetical protein U1A28_02240 [Patescibacteria group bacterium]|nr:hypothetical protein [Patescibacteria group bacterium]
MRIVVMMSGIGAIAKKAALACARRATELEAARRRANTARTAAKRAVALVRHGDAESAGGLISAAEKELEVLARLARTNPRLLAESFYREAVEEYVEAKALAAFVAQGRFVLPTGIIVDPEEMLGGLADATGELVRRAVTIAHESGALAELELYRAAAAALSHELAAVSEAGKLRQKHDEVERNLHRLEQLIYEIKGRGEE